MIDLHCHSTISDGMHTPSEVVKMAAENGCTMLALTDHDHTGGIQEAKQAAQNHAIQLIHGVEISVTWRGRTIHIVGLDFDIHHAQLQALLYRNRSGRIERAKQITNKLAKKGIEGAFEGALARASNPEMISRTHIADFLVDQQIVRTKQQAFTKYLGEGKSCSVAHEWASLEDAVAAIRAAQGIAVVAHPMRYDLSATARRNLFEHFKACGGEAIEVHSGRSQANDRLNYALLAERYELMASVGSDFHRKGDYSGGTLGTSPPLLERCRPVWNEFKI